MSNTFDSTALKVDATVVTMDQLAAEADLCTFDSSVTTFDSTTRTFDATTCQGDATPAPEAPAAQGGWIKRRRYLLPNDVLVWATPTEIQEILEDFVVVEQPKPKTKKQKRKARHEPFVPIEIEFVPMPDFSVQTFKPVLPPLRIWKPDLREMKRKAEALKRRIDDEEAILLLL